MNEAERFLAAKMKREVKPDCTQSAACTVSQNEPAAKRVADPTPCANQADAGTRSASPAPARSESDAPNNSGWSIGFGLFAVLATMFWMAVFKGGCR